MEDKRMLNEEELGKVSGGRLTQGTDFYNAGAGSFTACYCECKECGTTVNAYKLDDGYRYKYI